VFEGVFLLISYILTMRVWLGQGSIGWLVFSEEYYLLMLDVEDNSQLSLDKFNMLSVIGKGSYAKVVLVKKKGEDEGKVYAMKILKKKYIEKRKQENHVMTERNILVGMNHPFIVRLYNSFQNEKKLFFILEYGPGGELFGLLSKKQRLSE
jgi:serum/glucocorticoid-regulated kinase 2